MTEQVQDQTVTVQIGFENALNMASPAWRETWSQVAIDNARFFYNQGVRDTTPFASSAIQNMQNAIQGLQGGYGAIEDLASRPQQGGVIPDEIVAAAAEDTKVEAISVHDQYDAVQAEYDAVAYKQQENEALASANADIAQQAADNAVANDGAEVAVDAVAVTMDPTAPPAVDEQQTGEAEAPTVDPTALVEVHTEPLAI